MRQIESEVSTLAQQVNDQDKAIVDTVKNVAQEYMEQMIQDFDAGEVVEEESGEDQYSDDNAPVMQSNKKHAWFQEGSSGDESELITEKEYDSGYK